MEITASWKFTDGQRLKGYSQEDLLQEAKAYTGSLLSLRNLHRHYILIN